MKNKLFPILLFALLTTAWHGAMPFVDRISGVGTIPTVPAPPTPAVEPPTALTPEAEPVRHKLFLPVVAR